ncbi:hypothetical protein [Demequina sp.]|uniref:hypothetical protein n=1 Tax=Demequina sp. TaxID=2050685 RepID=UPI0025DC83E2|nr:hypothetical protein [Demequina sp.]
MEDLTEAGHVARWNGDHYVVAGQTGIDLGMIEPADGSWVWMEFATEYDREVDQGTRQYADPAEALHEMLKYGGWLV